MGKSNNLAQLQEWERRGFSTSIAKCVFISHKKEDADAAESIGKYLTDVVGVNIYLDSKDLVLQEAVSTDNDKKIVESIKRGLACSTHLLCVTSEKTRLSWWVPYEIGIADDTRLNIATLKLKGIDDVPSFLKIHEVMKNKSQFLIYCSKLGTYGSLFSREKYDSLYSGDLSLIVPFID